MIKDSGERREFESGAVRDIQEGKGRLDLLPACAIIRLAKHFENGANKYSERNWERGIHSDEEGQTMKCITDTQKLTGVEVVKLLNAVYGWRR